MATDAAFAGAGLKEGLELWRIEAFKPVKQPTVNGKFHTGDSYILLATTKKGNTLAHAIHFWLGAESSEDEQGTAAYKTVELDDSVGGGPQYRELQGSESNLFLSYFKNTGGIEYVPGGVSSGFHKVERDVYEPRLLHCKGARTVRVSPVPVSNKSLNKGDVFILDLGLTIYIFNGPTSNRQEKAKGVEVASRINSDERGGRAEIIYLEDDIKNPSFWGPLGGFIDPNSLPEGEDDSTVKATKVVSQLFKLVGTSFTSVTLPGGKLTKDLLTTSDVYLVHASKIFLWVGKKASLAQKKEASLVAVQYIKSAGLPASTQLERVAEGVETSSFKAEFAKWDLDIQVKSGVAKTLADQTIDVAALLARKQIEEKPFDDGTGTLDIWVVSNFQLEPVDPAAYGQFFGGDSYVVLYTYLKNKVKEYIIYFWLGDHSSKDEQGTAALMTKQKSDELGGRPVQVRVVQGKEPAHFRLLFKGKLIIHSGGKASGFKNVKDQDSYDTSGYTLYRVKGSTPLNTHAVQVKEEAASLNSEDAFVLETPTQVFLWLGRGSTPDEKSVGTNIAQILQGPRSFSVISEGSEPDEFWTAIGGRGEYSETAPGEPAPKEARLFECSDSSGSFKIDEVSDFTQLDLNNEDIYLLDTYTTVYLWIGSESNAHEKAKAAEYAAKFVLESNDGRDPDTPIVTIQSGAEPALFTSHFLAWDPALAAAPYVNPYEAAKQKAAAAKKAPAATPVVSKASTVAAAVAPKPAVVAGSYSFEEVKAGSIPGMDLTQKELYLDDATFKAKLGVDKAAFAALPKWKRDEKKKSIGIF